MAQRGEECYFRRVEVWNEEKQEVLVFLTNHLEWAGSTIGAIYQQRWQPHAPRNLPSVRIFFAA